MFPLRVQNAKDNDAIAFHAVKKFVREPAREQSAKIAIIKRAVFGINFQPANRRANFNQQFIAQPGALGFIPQPGLPHIRLRVRPDDDVPTHGRDGLRIRASTSSQDEPASGVRRYSSISRSSKAFSSGVATPLSRSRSSISQMRSKISRRAAISSLGNSARISILLMDAI